MSYRVLAGPGAALRRGAALLLLPSLARPLGTGAAAG